MMKLEHDGKKSPEQIGLAGLKLEILAKPPYGGFFYDKHKIFSTYEKFITMIEQRLRKISREQYLYFSLVRNG